MSDFFNLPDDTKFLFPNHGWARNTVGVRVLRIPLLRLYQLEAPYHDVYTTHKLSGPWLQNRSPYSSIRMLAVSLRDLSSELRIIARYHEDDWFHKPASHEQSVALTRYREASERSGVLLVAAFVLLRRLADQITDATRPLLFRNWQSAPRELKTAIKTAKDPGFSALEPTCDVGRLTTALLSHTQWFEDLRQEEGVRDILVHKDYTLYVTAQGSEAPSEKSFTWQVSAYLTRWRNGKFKSIDVIPILRRCISGACEFMGQICRSINMSSDYGRGDMVFLTGDDEDATSFWPTIGGAPSDA